MKQGVSRFRTTAAQRNSRRTSSINRVRSIEVYKVEIQHDKLALTCHGNSLHMSFPSNTSLPRASSSNPHELNNMARLNSQIILPSSLGSKVLCCAGLGLPQVPDGHIGQVFTSNGDTRFACDVENNWSVDGGRGVNPIRLVGDGHSIGLLGDYFVVLRLILVRAAFKAGDRGLGDVLKGVAIC